jgi:hypothetical protein
MESYEEANKRLHNSFVPRLGIKASDGIKSVVDTIGIHKAPKVPQKKNIDNNFDDFSLNQFSSGVGSGGTWYLSGYVESGSTKIRIRPGMVNNFIPTIDVSGTQVSIATVPAPGLVVTGTSGSVYLKSTVDTAGSITALVIESASSVPVDTSTEKHKLLGTWTASGGAFTSVVSILNANQTLYICNGTAIWEA